MASAVPDVVIVVAGATATGKTELGERLAERLDGEVVCGDARQLFAELDIGTGKPSAAERAARPHALFDWRRLGEPVSAGAWAAAAAAACERARAAARVPIVVGGSGLYLRALIEGLHGEPGADAGVRRALEAEWSAHGATEMHARLLAVDPETAARLPTRDRQRILRALEVMHVTGRPLSAWNAEPRRRLLDADIRVLEMAASPAALSDRIASRCRWMFANGLIEETRAIVAAGGQAALRELHAIGYDEALDVLAGRSDTEQACERTRVRTNQLAKRQRTWFRHQLTAERLDADREPAGGWTAAALHRLGIRASV